MRAKDTFTQAQLRLQAAGCRYRIKQAPRSPFIQVYDTLPPRRQQAARGYRVDDDQACWDLADLLLRVHERGTQGWPVRIWDELEASRAGEPLQRQLSWGELCGLVQTWIAPGGPKARDRNPFVCFRPKGYFGLTFDPDQIATTGQLEEFCLYTPVSLQLWREDPSHQLIRRPYNSKGFYGVIQMVN
ncbi:hypothetical protein [Synechococcus sp. CBW1004]|uniref:hypothetical protein n=1 Tax=Synechococcus sp. CBW1004 TaxID=1353136 RepID=UPI0018CD0034|nr:hypothetical protein [Synechococcus sp. CBW1004]QPN63824.1 hypothetical protein H8F25_02860 [Synechococcus sp. CBW1004]